MTLQPTCFLFLVYLLLPSPFQATSDRQKEYFTLMKDSLSGSALSDWRGSSAYCNYSGISCSNQGYVTKIEISGWSISGYLPPQVCSYLPELQVLDISRNKIQGNFPNSIINCSSLQVLNMSGLYLTGKLPNFSGMRTLQAIDLSYNPVEGDFPISLTNLTNLEAIMFNENSLFNFWKIPENITRLTNLKQLVLTSCNLHGRIPPSTGNMTSLVDLELSGNFLQGAVPRELGKLKNLKLLMLYYNQFITGPIPNALGNLTALTDLDMSVNNLTGEIPDSICHLPRLYTLQLYSNSLTGIIPQALEESRTLGFLSLYANHLTGRIPQNLGRFSPMILLDLSENQLSGQLPPDICKAGMLMYFLVLENMLTGEIPPSYAECTSLIRFRVSNNRLNGSVPENILCLPRTSIIDLGFNQLTGPIPMTIRKASNLSELFIQNNKISGDIPPEIAGAINLVKIDLSSNLLSGPIPTQIGSLKKLNVLLLQGNNFTSFIPRCLSHLKSLNLLDLSRNQLTGEIPDSLTALLPNSINFSYNQLSGQIPLPFIRGGQEESFLGNPHLCVTAFVNSSDTLYPLCQQKNSHKKLNFIWFIAISLAVVLVVILFFRGWAAKKRATRRQDETTHYSPPCSYDVKSFHRVRIDQGEILKSLLDKNIIGHGGSGTVYRIGINSGETVAVKKLWSETTTKVFSSSGGKQIFPTKELETEVETLGNIRHKNIVKLYSYISSWNCHLLVYEYMQNGNLWVALHKGKMLLDWPTRHQIALGVAQGLAYLHHDLLPPIIHRDVKSSNILLDIDNQPKVADFGVAKVLQTRRGQESSCTVIAGTYGYMDPDYVNSSKASTKCDVYSYGIVLMELLTGKKPVEQEFGENKNILNWIESTVGTKEGAVEVLDKRLSGSFKEEMTQLLRIAIRCTARAPAPRPTMNEVVQLLIEAERCRPFLCNSTKQTTEAPNSIPGSKREES